MTNHNREIGDIGEEYAEKFLISKNYHIIKKNFRWIKGEIDIICFDYSKKETVFVEVKTRTNANFGVPQDSVNFHKKQKILKTALHFLNSSRINHSLGWRVDVIAVKLNKTKELIDINHFINIFDA